MEYGAEILYTKICDISPTSENLCPWAAQYLSY